MHILQITPTSYSLEGVIGGGERLALYIDEAIRRAAAEAGRPVTTSVLSLSGAAASGAPDDRYQTVPGRLWDAKSLRANDLSPRLAVADRVYVHQCMTEVGLFAAAHARLRGIRVFGSDAGAGEVSLLQANPEAMLVYDAVHAISEFAAVAFSSFSVPVHVIAGPVDTDLHTPPPVDSPPRNPRLVVSVGRVLPHKGIHRTIAALPAGLELVVVGQQYDAEYLAFLREQAIGKDVRFEDGLGDGEVRALLREAGILVHASTHSDHLGRFYNKPELLGLAPLEALAMGLPALVSDAGSLAELGSLPGCFVFRGDIELASLLRTFATGQLSIPGGAAMHSAVSARYGLATVGRGLLSMMDGASP